MTASQPTLPQPKIDLSPDTLLYATGIHKSFTLHNQGGIKLPVLSNTSLEVKAGECVALTGESGSGKSTLMKALYGNYGIDAGGIWLKHNNHWVDLAQLQPHEIIEVRQKTIGYVSQFLRVIPRVSALDVAVEPLLELEIDPDTAYQKIKELFSQLNLPERLWQLSPTTFSGGEKQRVNIARALAVNYPIFLLDEPTSALDAKNRQVVVELLTEKKTQGCALIGIFHDEEVREDLHTRDLLFENN